VSSILSNSTISHNSASNGGGISNGSTVRLRNTIVAKNSGSSGSDLLGGYTSQGHNLIGIGDGSTGLTNGVNGDQVGTTGSPINPMLGSLDNNGGPTLTRALVIGSPAIDAGDNCVAQVTHCGDPNIPQLLTDQRGTGFGRAVDSNGDGIATVDIGAYEGAIQPTSIITVNSAADVANSSDGLCTLREAIIAARMDTASGAMTSECHVGYGAHTINFSVTGVINLATALPVFNGNDFTLSGPGASQLTIQRAARRAHPTSLSSTKLTAQ